MHSDARGRLEAWVIELGRLEVKVRESMSETERAELQAAKDSAFAKVRALFASNNLLIGILDRCGDDVRAIAAELGFLGEISNHLMRDVMKALAERIGDTAPCRG